MDKLSIEKAEEAPTDDVVATKEGLQDNVGGRASTQRRLRHYQVMMIGFCSGIGTGLFIAMGDAYAKAGPAGLLLAYSVVGIIVWSVVRASPKWLHSFPRLGRFHTL